MPTLGCGWCSLLSRCCGSTRRTWGSPWRWVIRLAFVAAPILMPLGFFLSVTQPDAQRPNGVIALVYVAGLALGVGAVTLGVGLLASG